MYLYNCRMKQVSYMYTHNIIIINVILDEAGHGSADGSCIKTKDQHDDKMRTRNAENGNTIVTRKPCHLGGDGEREKLLEN